MRVGSRAVHSSIFFFQAEDGIRDYKVTGVQTCALPICPTRAGRPTMRLSSSWATTTPASATWRTGWTFMAAGSRRRWATEPAPGNSIRFVFEYPDGPLRNTFTWKPETQTRQFVLESKNKQGQWANFAEEDLARATLTGPARLAVPPAGTRWRSSCLARARC